jgi:hypothetical protein
VETRECAAGNGGRVDMANIYENVAALSRQSTWLVAVMRLSSSYIAARLLTGTVLKPSDVQCSEVSRETWQ